MKRRGFTLIELLAVIVILAIIALIAVPTIINIIGNAQKSAFKDSAYGIIKAGELYYTNQMMEPEGMTEEKIFEFPEAVGLEYKGSKPTGGTLKVSKEGKVAIAINNGRYCVKKGYNENDVTINEDLVNCTIGGESTPEPATSIMTSENSCIKDTNAICTNGTEVAVQVNATDNYNFYVINDTKEELTLIMDRNIGNQVAWISSEDYIAAGGTSEDYGNTNKGPLTALNYLESQTSNWTNVPIMTYTLSDDGGGSKYSKITRTNVRARMLTDTETNSLGCINSNDLHCPGYLYTNTSSSNTVEAPSGYWLSSVWADYSIYVWTVCNDGGVYDSPVNYSSYFGVRPVITLSKSL